jgi:ribulose-5-phosphate 4-epimerase/fuculose-1-phosphate aldolase
MLRDEIWQARIDLAAAYRLAVRFGFNEGIDNHFTLMVPGSRDRFLLNAFGLHWSEVTASNLLVVDAKDMWWKAMARRRPPPSAFTRPSIFLIRTQPASCIPICPMPPRFR